MCLIPEAIPGELVREIDERMKEQASGEESLGLGATFRGDEAFGGQAAPEGRVSRLLWNLVNKGSVFLPLIDHPTVFPLVEEMLGDRIRLAALAGHMNGHNNEQIPLHQDQTAHIPRPLSFIAWANVMWLITDNSVRTGGTRVIPGSHLWPEVDSRKVNFQGGQGLAKTVEAPGGTALVFEGRLWHGNGLNRSGAVRNNILASYVPGWIRTQENYPYTVLDEVHSRASQRQRELLGFGHFRTLGAHDGSSYLSAGFDRTIEPVGILKS
ncbi:MAG: phytanoyl-CoA dioxygenase family protein [Candidatus Binatia bacterium]|nr:phytanoyl-CoA dioxygenase family protein [Candidatus Binatia bacterium]